VPLEACTPQALRPLQRGRPSHGRRTVLPGVARDLEAEQDKRTALSRAMFRQLRGEGLALEPRLWARAAGSRRPGPSGPPTPPSVLRSLEH
jgi:hypothetical protein